MASSNTDGKQGSGGTPAWMLRKNLPHPVKRDTGLDPKQALKKKMEEATLDPNLPPAFKVALQGRVAFAKQQARRKNNDTFVSLNSSHPVGKDTQNGVPRYVDGDDDDDSDSFASMGEDLAEEDDES